MNIIIISINNKLHFVPEKKKKNGNIKKIFTWKHDLKYNMYNTTLIIF